MACAKVWIWTWYTGFWSMLEARANGANGMRIDILKGSRTESRTKDQPSAQAVGGRIHKRKA